MIDAQLCRYLFLDLTPFQYDIPLCTGIEEACMTKSIVAILESMGRTRDRNSQPRISHS